MTWADDMKASALALAHPGFRLQDGDEIQLDVRACGDAELSSVTFEPGFCAIDVDVWRPTDRKLGDGSPGDGLVFRWNETGQHYIYAAQRCYLNEEAQEFFTELMRMGS